MREAYDIFQDQNVDPKTTAKQPERKVTKPKDSDTTKPKDSKSGKGGSKYVIVNPSIPDDTDAEGKSPKKTVKEERTGGVNRVDLLIRMGLGDMKKLYYFRNAIMDPKAAVKNPTLRPYVGEVADHLLDLIFEDSQLYNRIRALLQKEDKPRGSDTLPEETTSISRPDATRGQAFAGMVHRALRRAS